MRRVNSLGDTSKFRGDKFDTTSFFDEKISSKVLDILQKNNIYFGTFLTQVVVVKV